MRYFIELAYKGTAYNGWQRQPNAPSVQQSLEEALSRRLGRATEVVGAGRTDTGVHAAFYIAHFDTVREIADTADFCYHLNSMLPGDIAISRIYRVAYDAHARFDATEREYHYHILLGKEPFRRETTWQYFGTLDVEAMNDAASMLIEFSDFTSFAKLNSNNKTNICRIMRAEWSVRDDGVLCFTIRADRFLRNMVRSIVGTLVDVGRGRYTVADFVDIVAARDLSRSSAGAPAQGLFLSDVVYPSELFSRA